MSNSAHLQRDEGGRRVTIAAMFALLAFLGFNIATANAFSPSPTFGFSDSTGFTSRAVPVSSYRLSYSNNYSCQPLQVMETGFHPSWLQIESDVSTSTPLTTARLTVPGTFRGGPSNQTYDFGSPMTFLTAVQSGNGATSTLTFTMQFNSVRITSGGGVTTIRCSAP